MSKGSLLITNCVISNNIGTPGGIDAGGYYNAGLTALGCRIVNNTGGGGGGAYAWSKSVLDHCIIQGNSNGAGIYLKVGSGGSIIRNCLIADNKSRGIYIEAGATNQITACTIAGNYAYTSGGGVYLAGDGSDTFTNCMIASNSLNASAVDNNIYMTTAARTNSFYYSCSELLANTVQGNITAGPLFKNAASSDWRLQNGSPGMDVGINEGWMVTDTDLDGRARINYFRRQVDMGCYEYLPSGTMFSFH